MTDLPEDPNRWPNDPFKVLNLKRSDDARTARRAYFKLVRKFKPDQNPVEFQKVREAYEQVQTWMRYNQPADDDSENGDQGGDKSGEYTGEFSVPQADDLSPLSESEMRLNDPQQSGFGASVGTDLLDKFYQSLEEGNVTQAAAYLNQVGATEGPAKKAEANLIKYHLSNILGSENNEPPNLFEDPSQVTAQEQKRLSWLLKLYDSKSFQNAAYAELRTEFDRNYRLANCDCFKKFVNGIEDCQILSDVLQLRWEAIGHHDPNLVIDDVAAAQPKSLGFDGDSTRWIDLLAESMNYTVWQDSERCVKHSRECWREISESQQSWTADAVELRILAAEEWKVLRRETEWASALPWSKSTLSETARSIWNPIAVGIAAHPGLSLQRLNSLFQKYSIAMAVFEEGLRMLVSLDPVDVSNQNWDETRDLVACFFSRLAKSTGTTRYAVNRESIMDFCLLNQIPPNSFAYAANTFLDSDATVNWSDLIQKDGPLLCVYNACQAARI